MVTPVAAVPQLLVKRLQIATKLIDTHRKLLLCTSVPSRLNHRSESLGFPSVRKLSAHAT